MKFVKTPRSSPFYKAVSVITDRVLGIDRGKLLVNCVELKSCCHYRQHNLISLLLISPHTGRVTLRRLHYIRS